MCVCVCVWVMRERNRICDELLASQPGPLVSPSHARHRECGIKMSWPHCVPPRSTLRLAEDKGEKSGTPIPHMRSQPFRSSESHHVPSGAAGHRAAGSGSLRREWACVTLWDGRARIRKYSASTRNRLSAWIAHARAALDGRSKVLRNVVWWGGACKASI